MQPVRTFLARLRVHVILASAAMAWHVLVSYWADAMSSVSILCVPSYCLGIVWKHTVSAPQLKILRAPLMLI
jgi:hypothetical protein